MNHSSLDPALFAAAVQSAMSGIAIADTEGRLIYVNDAALKIWRYESADEVLGNPLSQYWANPGLAAACWQSSWKKVATGRILRRSPNAAEQSG